MASKSMTSSPRSSRNSLHNPVKKEASSTNDAKSDATLPTIKQPESEGKSAAGPANAPLAPPPKPSQNGDGDYFSGAHSLTNLSKEPNPFENAFGNPSDTPGKSQLPGVASLTSPASLLPNNTPGWPGSLRSGPLSPAMLAGPTGTTSDYFNSEHHFGGSFPTPNESSLRSGLTPGGTGSMFPQPSPNSQALLQQLHAGGATPGTLDFHRTAMTARAQQSQSNPYSSATASTSMAPSNPNIQPDLDSKPYNPNGSNSHQDSHDPFGSHQTNDAANGLFMLAQAGGQRNSQSNFNLPQQPQGFSQAAQEKRVGKIGSIGSNVSASTDPHEGQYSDDAKPQSRNARNGKKGSTSKPTPANKRKTEETPVKGSANKKQRANSGNATPSEEPEDDDEDGMDDIGTDGKKMTDEEKRKNFLERNRVAALKCRQRKKQWLANLQHKVEVFTSENDALATTVTSLREEIVGLKTLLLAHKDCPVSQAQGISGMAMQQIAGTDSGHGYANPYGMAMGQGGPGMHRR